MSPSLHGPLSTEENLRTEIESGFRREYVGGSWYGPHGESHEEDGTTAAHNRITTNVMVMRSLLPVSPCPVE